MMFLPRLSQWLLDVASWRTTLAAFVLAGALIGLMNVILIPAVASATGGLDPFDIIFPLSTKDLLDGLDQYNSDSFKAYLVFTGVDVAFPIASGMFSLLFAACLIKLSGFSWLITAAKRGFILLAFIPTLFDLMENVGFVVLIASLPETSMALASATTFVHAAKFQSMDALSVAQGVLIALALAGVIMRWRASRKAL